VNEQKDSAETPGDSYVSGAVQLRRDFFGCAGL
jgi:hypothetical protein